MAQAQLVHAAAAAALAMESLEEEQEEMDPEVKHAADYLVNNLRQVEASKPVPGVGSGLPIKRRRNHQMQSPSARTRRTTTTSMMMMKKPRTQAKSARAMPSKPARRAAPKRIAPKITPMTLLKTETIATAPAAAGSSTTQIDNLPQTGSLNTFDITLPISHFSNTLAAPQLTDPNATHIAHERALLFFGLYFDMYLAQAIESQTLCDPSHYAAPADLAALVLGPSSASRTHIALFKYQILQSFATLLSAHSNTLSLDSLFHHFLACCISHGLTFG